MGRSYTDRMEDVSRNSSDLYILFHYLINILQLCRRLELRHQNKQKRIVKLRQPRPLLIKLLWKVCSSHPSIIPSVMLADLESILTIWVREFHQICSSPERLTNSIAMSCR